MAKNGLFGGGMAPAAPRALPMASSPRPMPNPGMAAPQAQGGGLLSGLFGVGGMGGSGGGNTGGGGLFGNLDPQTRYDMTMELLKAGMGAAGASGSPLAAFVAPLAGAMIGGKAASNFQTAKDSAVDDLTASMMGGLPPEAAKYTDVLENPLAPDYLKSAAKKRLEDLMAPPKAAKGGGSKGRGRRSAPKGAGGVTTGGVPLYGETIGPDGALYGRTKDGRVLPYAGPDGQPFKPKGKSESIDPLGMGNDDPLGLKSAPAPDNDPLGIRN